MTTTIKREQNRIRCNFCKEIIFNNSLEPLHCICSEGNKIFHLKCYEESGRESNQKEMDKVDINEVVRK
jgi:hypothetical protein